MTRGSQFIILSETKDLVFVGMMIIEGFRIDNQSMGIYDTLYQKACKCCQAEEKGRTLCKEWLKSKSIGEAHEKSNCCRGIFPI